MASPSARHWAGTRHTRPCHPGGSSLGASAGTCDFRIPVCGPWPSPPGATVISGVRGSPGQPREGTGGGQGGPSPRRTFRRARSLACALGSACGAGGNTAGTARHAVCSVPASCADRALPKVTDAGAICGTRCGRQRAVADGRAGPTRYVASGCGGPRGPLPHGGPRASGCGSSRRRRHRQAAPSVTPAAEPRQITRAWLSRRRGTWACPRGARWSSLPQARSASPCRNGTRDPGGSSRLIVRGILVWREMTRAELR